MSKENLDQNESKRRFLGNILSILVVFFVVVYSYFLFSKKYLIFSFLSLFLIAMFICLNKQLSSRIKFNQVAKIFFWLTAVTSFFGPAFVAIPLGHYHVFLSRLFLLLTLSLLMLGIFINKGKIAMPAKNIKYYLLFIVFWFVYAIATLIWAEFKTAALIQIFFLFVGFSLIFLMILYLNDLNNLKRFFFLWIVITAGLIGMGLWEHLTGNHLPTSTSYGVDRSDIRAMPSSVFHNTNDYATFIGLSIPFILSWMRYRKRFLIRLSGFVLSGLGVYFVIINLSRANLLALMIEAFVFFAFFLPIAKKIKWSIAIGLTVAFSILFNADFSSKIVESVCISAVESTSGRITLINSGLYYFMQSYGFGVGAGNIEPQIANYAPYQTGIVVNIHNWWVEILANYGILTFVGYLAFYFGLIMGLWKARYRISGEAKMICEALVLSLIGFSVASISSSSIVSFEPQWLLLGFALAFLNYYRNDAGRIKTEAD